MAMNGQGSVWYQTVITISNKGRGCHYITEEVKSKIDKELSTIMIGTLHLFMKHTSASIMLNESWDASVKDDMEMMLNRWAPENLNYHHSCEGPDDMPAHAKHALMGSSVTIPITNGKLNLGTWQGIWIAEHRNGKKILENVADNAMSNVTLEQCIRYSNHIQRFYPRTIQMEDMPVGT